MSEQRIPKPGEAWRCGPSKRTVINVYPDAVTFLGFDGEVYAVTLDDFLECSTPPEPTVVASLHFTHRSDSGFILYGHEADANHRLDLMSDGEFRVVKL